MLNPHHIRLIATHRHQMRILNNRVARLLGRHIFRPHPLRPQLPRLPTIIRYPHSPARNTHRQMIGVPGIDAHRMNSRIIKPSPEPLHPPRIIPERTIQLPRFSQILRKKQPAGDRAAPHSVRTIRPPRFHRPYQPQFPLRRLAGKGVRLRLVSFRRFGIHRAGDFLPRLPPIIRSMNFLPEMFVFHGRKEHFIPGVVHHQRTMIAYKRCIRNRPALRATGIRKESFASGDE